MALLKFCGRWEQKFEETKMVLCSPRPNEQGSLVKGNVIEPYICLVWTLPAWELMRTGICNSYTAELIEASQATDSAATRQSLEGKTWTYASAYAKDGCYRPDGLGHVAQGIEPAMKYERELWFVFDNSKMTNGMLRINARARSNVQLAVRLRHLKDTCTRESILGTWYLPDISVRNQDGILENNEVERGFNTSSGSALHWGRHQRVLDGEKRLEFV